MTYGELQAFVPLHSQRTTADNTTNRLASSAASSTICAKGLAPTLHPPYQMAKAVTPGNH